MKTLIILLSVSALLLLGANVFVRTRPSESAKARPETRAWAESKMVTVGPRKVTIRSDSEDVPALRWDNMESSDYKGYIANLRHVGFPEELIREIIIADVNKMYAEREELLKTPAVPEDASVAARSRKPTVEDVEKLLKLREVQIEKHALMEQLLGVKVPREIIRGVNPRNYEAGDFAVRQLPPEKQQQALEIFEKEILLDDLNQARGLRGAEEMAAYRKVNEERDAALKALLTPEEFERFMMNAIPPGTEMQRRVMGMEPTDDELLAMWKITHEHWKEQGGVFGRWRAERMPEEEIRAADEKLEQRMRETLGPDRYLDYQLATSGTGQQLKNLAARYDLSRETLSNAFHLQKEVDRFEAATRLRTRYGAALPDGGSANGGRTMEMAEADLAKTLGAERYQSWKEGRNLKYDLQP